MSTSLRTVESQQSNKSYWENLPSENPFYTVTAQPNTCSSTATTHAQMQKNMASDSVPRRRAWGRPKRRDEITVVNEMEIELAEKESREAAKTKSDADSDLQRPEGMTNNELIAILEKMRVPIPVSTNEIPSRERLLYLFRRHVTPRPQRTRRSRRSQRRLETDATPTESGNDRLRQTKPGVEWSETVSGVAQESSEYDRKRPVDSTCCFQIASRLYSVKL